MKVEYFKVYKTLISNKKYKAFYDQYCHYIEINKLIKIFKKIISSNKNKFGIMDIYDDKIYISRYDFAKRVALREKLNLNYLKKVSISNSNLPLPKQLLLR